MPEVWSTVRLDTQEKAEHFYEVFYSELNDLAWTLSGQSTEADKLTEQVFSQMKERFAQRELPADPMIYMRSLLHQLSGGHVRSQADAAAEKTLPDVRISQADPAIREQTVFDAQKTSMWLPGETFDNAELNQARAEANARPKKTGDTKSVKLSIFNTLLFLTAIAAGAFLLYELGIMYDLL